MRKKIIIGFAGEMACGKGTAAKYLSQHWGGETFRFSTALFDVARRLHLPESRDSLQRISTSLRKEFGEDLLAKVILVEAKDATRDVVVVDGVRRREDVKYLRELPNFVLCYITAPIRTRYERMVLRGEKADDTTKTFEEFEKDHHRETEIEIPELKSFAAEIVDNAGTLPEFHAQLDAIVKKYGE